MHSALVIENKYTSKISYITFGRYHLSCSCAMGKVVDENGRFSVSKI
jgi:hypothetical protein